MEMKILWAGALFFCGWLWFYLFVRQICFNLLIAYPEVKAIRKADKELIAPSADKYTTTSMIVCSLLSAVIAFIIIKFCSLLLMISFFLGAVIAFAMYIGKMKISNRAMFDTFCKAYYRFIPDDELRTAMYNCKPSQMKLRLHIMERSTDFIPDFK